MTNTRDHTIQSKKLQHRVIMRVGAASRCSRTYVNHGQRPLTVEPAPWPALSQAQPGELSLAR
jgi:hypothetical protein